MRGHKDEACVKNRRQVEFKILNTKTNPTCHLSKLTCHRGTSVNFNRSNLTLGQMCPEGRNSLKKFLQELF